MQSAHNHTEARMNEEQNLHGATEHDGIDCLTIEHHANDEVLIKVYEDAGVCDAEADLYRVEGVMLNSVRIAVEHRQELVLNNVDLMIDQPLNEAGDLAWVYVNSVAADHTEDSPLTDPDPADSEAGA